MTDEDILARVASLFGVSYCKCYTVMEHYKPTYKTTAYGSRAYHLMIKLKPLMGIRRKNQIDNALKDYKLPIKSTELPSADIILQMYETLSIRDIDKKIGCTHQRIHRIIKKINKKDI